ncbi:unnamed protein product [Somion occarium]|uniref:DWNN-domain-containing protein n=1 Tax=Somion occarium TaxID=3059160 RepID=A0ABP1E4R4_9APHY
MASSVFYKFKSQKDESRVTFDGTGISVFDLKKEIILANNLDDSTIIPRASSVIVKRVFVRPGKGKAAMYISAGSSSTGASDQASKSTASSGGSYSWHRGNMTKRFDGREETTSTLPKPTPVTIKSNIITKGDEAAAMAAMFQASAANWEETQEKMSQSVSRLRVFLVLVVVIRSNELILSWVRSFISNSSATPVYSARGGAPGRGRGGALHHRQPDRPLPPSYVCYRCGQKGHWIQDCPTNNDRDYDNRPRIKRTTGIPRSFLKAVESPSTGPIGHGVMVTPEGGYVVAQPDVASWQKQVSRPKGLTEADIREKMPSDPALSCPIDNKLFKDAVKTPCCGKLYCEECIQTHLLERDFVCPNCGAKIPSLDKLIIDKPTRSKVGEYIDKEIEKSKQEGAGGEEESKTNGHAPQQPEEKQLEFSTELSLDQEYYSDQQPGSDMDALHMAADSIPHIQAQINQISVMLNNPTLPMQVRQQTEMKHHQLHMELQQAQMAAALIQAGNAAAFNAMNMQAQQAFGVNVGMQMGGPQMGPPQQQQWTNPFSNQQPAGQDSAYQRLPLNNRRRNLKRERPSDFLEIAGNEQEAKMPRYWE